MTNNPTTQNMTKQTLGNRSFINQVKYSPKYQSVAIVGTNDGNVMDRFQSRHRHAGQANWVDVTGNNTVVPNRPVLGIALDPTVSAANLPVGYAAVGGFNANTPTTPGHVFQVTCTAELRLVHMGETRPAICRIFRLIRSSSIPNQRATGFCRHRLGCLLHR